MRDMKKRGSEYLGEILDPDTGWTYRCRMTLKDGGQKLLVRGFLGMALFGRTQIALLLTSTYCSIVEEADAGAGTGHQRANRPGRRFIAFGRFIESRETEEAFGDSKQIHGERKAEQRRIRRASSTLTTWLQSRPEVLPCRFISWLARPTPMMEPTMVCNWKREDRTTKCPDSTEWQR